MLFMSEEHVEAMNALLRTAAPVVQACAALPQPRAMAYVLAHGPRGEPVYWTMSFIGTVQFSLVASPDSNVTFSGDWTQMIRASKANREGHPLDPGLSLAGDPAVLTEIGPVMELARTVATLPVDFPEV